MTTNPTPPLQLQLQPQPTIEPQTGAFDCKLFVSHLPPDIYLFIIIYYYLGAVSSTVIPSWKAFFEKHREQNECLKAQEMPKQRQSRESREKNPPTKKTKVFLWR